MIKHWQKIHRYNRWAWNHLFSSLKELSDEQFSAPGPYFWGSIHGVVAHSLGAEEIWINRLNGNNPATLSGLAEYPTLDAIMTGWEPIQAAWEIYLNQLTTEQAGQILTYRSTEGETRQNKVEDIVQQIFNHGTEHRSQLTPILYQLGFPTPPLDYIFFTMETDA